MKISYNWLKSYIPEISPAEKLADIFTYHLTEVEGIEKIGDDTIFDLNILPNRAHDLLSHQGIARELAGQLGISFKDPTPLYKIPESKPTNLKIEIHSDKCRRYTGRIVRNVKIGSSPEWVVKHLESIGQRSINNIVDATNIVMYDCGQPCHAFDLKMITNYQLLITNAKEGEELKLVGREEIVVKLKETDLVISTPSTLQGEGRGEVLLALAGVKGGFDSGINENTTDIVLEVANFNPTLVRKTARRIGQLSDSAKRFENDLSPTLCDFAILELSALILEMCPDAQFEEIVDEYKVKQEERKISFDVSTVNKKLGSNISSNEIQDILVSYSYLYKRNGDLFEITVPPLRLDLIGVHDIIEEIGRVYGYDKIKPELPKINFTPKENDIHNKIIQVRNILINAGYKEVMTYSFTDKGEVEVLASASNKNFLRTNLSDGLKKSYELNKLNAPFLRLNEIKIFEIGTVFKDGKEYINVGYINKKEVKEMSLNKFITTPAESFLQVLGSPVQSAEASGRPDHLENLSSDYATNETPFKMWSLYPFITRDIAVWVPEGTDTNVLSDIYKEFGTELLQSEPNLIDTFSKEGRTSYAFRLVFQASDRTLIDDEVNLIMTNITEKLLSLDYIVR